MSKKNKNDIDFEKEFENFEEEVKIEEKANEGKEVNNENIMPDFEEGCECSSCECSHDNSKEEFYLNLAQRVQAEFDNYRKRTKTAEIDAKEKGKIDAVLELLPVVDSLDNARKVVKSPEAIDAINIIEKQIYLCFDKLGVKKMESLGARFDANLHNAIMCGQDENEEDDIVLQVFQEGFTMNDKVIRYAMVQVNKL